MVIVDFIVLDLCLNAVVNGHEFNKLLTYLTPGYTVPSRMFVMNYLKQHHSIVKTEATEISMHKTFGSYHKKLMNGK